MSKKVLLIIASQDFQPIEYSDTRKILESGNIEVFTASNARNNAGNAVAKDGMEVEVDFLLDEVDVNNYDGIFIIGGSGALEHLDNEKTYRIIREIDLALKKPYGAICISTRILAHANVLDGRKVTGWDKDGKLQDILTKCGAEYIKTGVIIERNLITAAGPEYARDFGHAILETLNKPIL